VLTCILQALDAGQWGTPPSERSKKKKKRAKEASSLSQSAPAESSKGTTSVKTRQRRLSSGSEQPKVLRTAPLTRSHAIADLKALSTRGPTRGARVAKRKAHEAFGPSLQTNPLTTIVAKIPFDEVYEEEERQRMIRRRVGPEWMPGAWVPTERYEDRGAAKGNVDGYKSRKSARFAEPQLFDFDAVVDDLWKTVGAVIKWALGN
jgi:hypothetical protein